MCVLSLPHRRSVTKAPTWPSCFAYPSLRAESSVSACWTPCSTRLVHTCSETRSLRWLFFNTRWKKWVMSEWWLMAAEKQHHLKMVSSVTIIKHKCPLVFSDWLKGFPFFFSIAFIAVMAMCMCMYEAIQVIFCYSLLVFCEGLHDPYCKTAAGAGYHPRIRIPVCCECDRRTELMKRKKHSAAHMP